MQIALELTVAPASDTELPINNDEEEPTQLDEANLPEPPQPEGIDAKCPWV